VHFLGKTNELTANLRKRRNKKCRKIWNIAIYLLILQLLHLNIIKAFPRVFSDVFAESVFLLGQHPLKIWSTNWGT